MRILNNTLEARPRTDGKVDVFGKSLSDDWVWLATLADENLAGVLIEATYAWDYTDLADNS